MSIEGDEQSYRDIFESFEDGLILSDLESGLVVEANPAAAAMHGYAPAEFIGLHPARYMPPAVQAQFEAWVRSVDSGNSIEASVTHMRRDGTPFSAELRGTACTWRQRPCLLIVVRDVSARVRSDRLFRQEMEGQLLEQATRLKKAQAHAVLDERKRLAQNLHDAVNQSLFSAGLIAEVLPRLLERHPEQVRESLEDLRRLIRGALAEMRGLLVELQPIVLTDSNLDDLLHLLGDALTGRTNIPVALTVSGEGLLREGELPADVQMALYRLCQEALSNIGKHSSATEATIELRYEDDYVVMSIRDNGSGFDLNEVPSGRFGLSMMREHAEAVGAALDIASAAGQGTEVLVTWRGTRE